MDLRQEIFDYICEQKQTEFKLTVEPIKSKRSDAQNRLLHVLCRDFVTLAQEKYVFDKDLSHWTMEHYKAIFTNMYLKATDPKTGIEIVKSTSQLDTKQFATFLDKIIKDYLEQGGALDEGLIASGWYRLAIGREDG